MNISAIRTALYSWAKAHAPGAGVVWSDQAAPRPPKPYVTLRLAGPFRDHGDDELRWSETDQAFVLSGPRRLTLGVQTFGVDDLQTHVLAERLNFSLRYEEVKSLLHAAGLAVSDAGDVNNVTVFIDTRWEPRFSFDVVLLTVATGSDTIGTVETVELNNQIIP